MSKQSSKTINCPSCGMANQEPLAAGRCLSCGLPLDDSGSLALSKGSPLQQQGFQPLWFAIALGVIALLTTAIVVGLPWLIPLFDFEGYAGMMLCIPVWFVGGCLVGLISPGRTYIEPMLAAAVIAVPTVFLLFQGQTVKTMPLFMYLLFAALGVLFALVGAYAGERIQVMPPRSTS